MTTLARCKLSKCYVDASPCTLSSDYMDEPREERVNTGFSEITQKRVEYNGVHPWYMEVAITGKCNFSCKYCNRFVSDLDIDKLEVFLKATPMLHHIQITGGEPTIHPEFQRIVKMLRRYTKVLGLSTNGSATLELYTANPVDMYSISFDDFLYENLEARGYVNPAHVENIIRELSKMAYVNVGLVIDGDNVDRIERIIQYILNMGVNDIKLSVNSHYVDIMPNFTKMYEEYPILSYRVKNFMLKKPMRGFPTKKCHIMENDITVVGGKHYPCLVYFREHGKEIGDVSLNMLTERQAWADANDCTKDPICSKFCMDFKCDFNKERQEYITTASN